MEIIKVPVISYRRIPNPLEQEGKRMSIAVLRVKDLPATLQDWKKVNIRDSSEKTGVSRDISNSLHNSPKDFFFKNRGITLLVDKVDFRNDSNLLYLELSEQDLHGILDGGHTYEVIRHIIDSSDETDISKFDEAYVRVEILDGFTDKIETVNIVEARNTSAPVKDQSIEDLQGAFIGIKDILDGQSYDGRISYKETEFDDEGHKKDIDIKEILSYLICFDTESFNNENHPIITYSSKSGVLKHVKNRNKEKKLEKYLPLLPDILKLKDTIYYDMPNTYNKTGGKFGRLTGVILKKKNAKPIELPFIQNQSEFVIPSSFIYPILASLRNLVKIENGICSWKTDPFEFFQTVNVDLITRLIDQAKENNSPNKLGKSKQVWQSCYDKTRLEILELGL